MEWTVEFVCTLLINDEVHLKHLVHYYNFAKTYMLSYDLGWIEKWYIETFPTLPKRYRWRHQHVRYLRWSIPDNLLVYCWLITVYFYIVIISENLEQFARRTMEAVPIRWTILVEIYNIPHANTGRNFGRHLPPFKNYMG